MKSDDLVSIRGKLGILLIFGDTGNKQVTRDQARHLFAEIRQQKSGVDDELTIANPEQEFERFKDEVLREWPKTDYTTDSPEHHRELAEHNKLMMEALNHLTEGWNRADYDVVARVATTFYGLSDESISSTEA